MLKSLQVELEVVFLKENNKFIAYCPALDLSSCGDTFEQAKKRIDEAAELFLEEIINSGTMEEVLLECGWHKTASPDHPWMPPAIIAQTKENISVIYSK
jgi:predicted RNase H-like HicB family nuclease